MDKVQIAIGIPSHGSNPFRFTIALAALVGYIAKGIKTRDKYRGGLKCGVLGLQSSNIVMARHKIVSQAIKEDYTHILFLDHDMRFYPDVIDIMLGRHLPIVACNYLIKDEELPSHEFVAVGLDGIRVPTTETSEGLQEIAYCGFGVSLFDVNVFKNTPQPWFWYEYDPGKEGVPDGYTTEDNPCFWNLHRAGHKVYLDHDASKLVSHLGEYEWKWDRDYAPAEVPPAPTPVIHSVA